MGSDPDFRWPEALRTRSHDNPSAAHRKAHARSTRRRAPARTPPIGIARRVADKEPGKGPRLWHGRMLSAVPRRHGDEVALLEKGTAAREPPRTPHVSTDVSALRRGCGVRGGSHAFGRQCAAHRWWADWLAPVGVDSGHGRAGPTKRSSAGLICSRAAFEQGAYPSTRLTEGVVLGQISPAITAWRTGSAFWLRLAVLLALHLACVAGEHAVGLSTGRKSGLNWSSARAMPRRIAPAWPV